MADFKVAYAVIARIEGGYVNHPNDRGGETWAGIARKMHPKWEGWAIIDSLKARKDFPSCLEGNTRLKVLKEGFYKSGFWDTLRLDDVVDANIAKKLFDISVNCGYKTAAKFLQKSLNLLNNRQRLYPDVEVDGQVGKFTLSALNNHPRPDNVFKALNVLQGSLYLQLGESDESQEAFMNGWFANRVAAVFNPDAHSDLA